MAEGADGSSWVDDYRVGTPEYEYGEAAGTGAGDADASLAYADCCCEMVGADDVYESWWNCSCVELWGDGT